MMETIRCDSYLHCDVMCLLVRRLAMRSRMNAYSPRVMTKRMALTIEWGFLTEGSIGFTESPKPEQASDSSCVNLHCMSSCLYGNLIVDPSVTANWTLFDGGQRYQALKQQKLQNTIDELSVNQNENDIRISLIQAYMQVLYSMEAVRINENTVEVSRAQRDRAIELLKAGSISKVDLAQLESQYSTDQYQLVVAKTTLDNYKLQLKQLLELDITQEIELVMPELTDEDILEPLPDKKVIYATSLSVMPEIESGKLAVDVAELEKKKAWGAFLPTLSMNAGIGTGHLSGTDYTFGSQIWDKFNESIGLTISIPIFSNRQYKTAYNKAKYALTTSRLDLADSEKQLLRNVESVYLDAISAQNQYTSATERLSYVTESYTLTEEQFNLGMKNTVELLTEKNNFLTAQQERLQAKYMALMSIQILNVYQAKPIAESF